MSEYAAEGSDKHVHAARPHAFLLRNYETWSRLHGTNMFKIWQGMRATSAAPSYWAPCSDDRGRVFVDGGVGNNNPTLLAYLEAKSLWPNNEVNAPPPTHPSAAHEGPWNPLHNPIGLVVSLGTGLADQKVLSSLWVNRALDWVTSSLTTGEMVHDLCTALFTGHVMPAYLRFQPRQNAGALLLDESDPKKLQGLLDITDHYLATEPYATRFNLLCDMLANDEHSKEGSVMTAAMLDELEEAAVTRGQTWRTAAESEGYGESLSHNDEE